MKRFFFNFFPKYFALLFALVLVDVFIAPPNL